MFFVLLFLLAFLAGFAAKRGGVCLVAATRELIMQKKVSGFLFILEAMIVALAVVLGSYILFPSTVQLSPSVGISVLFIGGALCYGLGAGINSGCALGTLNKLMAGNLTFAGTILGMCLGFFAFLMLQRIWPASETLMVMRSVTSLYILIPLLLAALAVIVSRLWQLFFSQTQPFRERVRLFLHEPLARNFLAIFILGVCSGGLYLLLGHAWDYSRWIISFERIALSLAPLDKQFAFISTTSAGLLIGVMVAAMLARSFQIQGIEWRDFLLKIFAGSLMGLGAGFIHGGNDTLLLHGVPTLAFHAPYALLLMLLIIGAWLRLKIFVSSRIDR